MEEKEGTTDNTEREIDTKTERIERMIKTKKRD